MQKYICDSCGEDMGETAYNSTYMSMPSLASCWEWVHLCEDCQPTFALALTRFLAKFFLEKDKDSV